MSDTRTPMVVSVVTGEPRPRWRGMVHAWAFWLSIPAVVVLLFVVADQPLARMGAAVFGISTLLVYGASSAYHRLARGETAQRIMRKLDHSMIFVMIAGTYTPICLIVLPTPRRELLLAAVWVTAFGGMAVKTWGRERFMRRSNALYIVMGWFGLAVLPVIFRTMSPLAIIFMFIGGGLYTIGAVLFGLRRLDFKPDVFGYHEVWHVFTVLAGISHFAMVALVLR